MKKLLSIIAFLIITVSVSGQTWDIVRIPHGSDPRTFFGIANLTNYVLIPDYLIFKDQAFNAVNQTNATSYFPSNLVNISTNYLTITNGLFQKLVCTNRTTLTIQYTGLDTNQSHSICLALYIGTNSFTLDTNSVLIEANDTLGVDAVSFLSRLHTNRYNTIMFFRGLSETYFRANGLDF